MLFDGARINIPNFLTSRNSQAIVYQPPDHPINLTYYRNSTHVSKNLSGFYVVGNPAGSDKLPFGRRA